MIDIMIGETVTVGKDFEQNSGAIGTELDQAKVFRLLEQMSEEDLETASHEMRVARICVLIAKEMSIPPMGVQAVKLAALCHDAGKMKLPPGLLSKQGPLTEEEKLLHMILGWDVWNKADISDSVRRIAFQHHERLDGSGYPLGLARERVLLGSRILAVADVIDAGALRGKNPDMSKISKILAEINEFRDIQYDPRVVDACIKICIREKGFGFRLVSFLSTVNLFT